MRKIFYFAAGMAAAIGFSLPVFAKTDSPSVSANTLFLYRHSDFHSTDANPASVDTSPNGFNVREAELQFYSDVDPYHRLNLVLSIHPEISSDGTNIEEKWVIEPEEAFAESLDISGVTFKFGKFKAAIGKHNTLHTHAFPFVEAPLANTGLLGDEGFNDTGLSAAILAPFPWYSELQLQLMRGQGENEEFKHPSPASAVSVARWTNLLDLSESLTLELGLSGAEGGNSFRGKTQLTGGDLTLKWRPTEGGKYHAFIWSTEYLGRTRTQAGLTDERAGGISSWLQYQFAQRWSALLRYDGTLMKDSFDPAVANDTQDRGSIALAFEPSEFSIWKLEYDQRHGAVANTTGATTEHVIYFQGNFTIGAHPAHAY